MTSLSIRQRAQQGMPEVLTAALQCGYRPNPEELDRVQGLLVGALIQILTADRLAVLQKISHAVREGSSDA